MLISLIFFYLAVKINCMYSISSCNRTPATTELHRFNNQILRRRIRSLVFPNKAQLLLTPAFSKAILDGRPRGLTYSVEFDMYNPLPDTVNGWQPTILINQIKEKIKTSNPLKTNSPHLKRVLETRNRIFTNYTEQPNRPNFLHDYYHFPFNEDEETSDFHLEWSAKKKNFANRNFQRDSNKLYGFVSNFHKLPFSQNKCNGNKKCTINSKTKVVKRESSFAKEFDHDLACKQERIQIHKQLALIGKIFKFNTRNCIKRAICELNSRFKKHGESVIVDIIRIILIPAYRPNVATERDTIFNINCKERFPVSCPFSILDIFTKNIISRI